jgi:hypothetical protein
MGDICHVDSARGDVRRDENSHSPPLKSVECAEALRQRAISMDDRNTLASLL